MKLVIGLVGLPLAGKETVANKLEELVKKDGYSVSRHRFSDVLRDTLDLWGMEHRAGQRATARADHAEAGGIPGRRLVAGNEASAYEKYRRRRSA